LEIKATKIVIIVVLSTLFVASIFVDTANAITNGQPDGNNHPYVVLVVADIGDEPAWRGTGILLSPTVVLTAGHVTDGADACRIWLYEDVTYDNVPYPLYPYGGPGSGAIEGTPYTNPDYAMGASPGLVGFLTHDVGIIVLDEPAVVDRYGDLPTEGLVDTLPVMTNIDFVGYGVQTNIRGGGQPYWTGPRIRMYAPAKLLSTQYQMNDQFIKCTANPGQGKGGTAFGDSGGPALLGGTDTVLAVTSFGTNNNCAGTGYYCRVDKPETLDWIKGFLA